VCFSFTRMSYRIRVIYTNDVYIATHQAHTVCLKTCAHASTIIYRVLTVNGLKYFIKRFLKRDSVTREHIPEPLMSLNLDFFEINDGSFPAIMVGSLCSSKQ